MYWVFATLYTFFTIIISQFLEKDVKYLFYLVMVLLFVSLNNIYYSIQYYIELRNNKGIKGDRGVPGDEGQDGSNGVCVMSNTCGLLDCDKLVEDRINIMFPEYKMIKNKDVDARSDDENASLKHIDKSKEQLIDTCKNFDGSVSSFTSIIDNALSI
jgi:hypothetical protein